MRRGFPWLVGLIPMIAAAACGSADGTLGVSTALHSPGVTPADGAIAYVIYQNSGTVTPIRTATNTALKPIKVGAFPVAIAITPDGRTAYVVSDGGTVTPIRTATNTALTPIKVGRLPFAIAITKPSASSSPGPGG
jgi:YVTN family beta-propeller protein